MQLRFDQDQDALRRSLRSFLERHSSSGDVRRAIETDEGFDRDVWARLSGELGLSAVGVPEELGGSGGQLERTVIFEEMGRSLFCGPYLSSTLAAEALVLSADVSAGRELIPRIIEGSVVTLALCGDRGAWSVDQLPLHAASAAGRWTLSGTATYVLDGMTAELILAVAATAAGASLFVVDPADAANRRPLRTLDLTRPLAELTFSDAPARLVGAAGGVAAWLGALLDLGRVCVAAEQVGGAQWCLDAATEYAKQRFQFDRPIGSFQAVKHLLAEMLVDVENARSAAYVAAWSIADESADRDRVVPLATAVCAEAFRKVSADCIQVHGGIGFTWEHDAHLYYRRAGASAMQFGDASDQWDVLAGSILEEARHGEH